MQLVALAGVCYSFRRPPFPVTESRAPYPNLCEHLCLTAWAAFENLKIAFLASCTIFHRPVKRRVEHLQLRRVSLTHSPPLCLPGWITLSTLMTLLCFCHFENWGKLQRERARERERDYPNCFMNQNGGEWGWMENVRSWCVRFDDYPQLDGIRQFVVEGL